jgi:Flp pilus assembly protein TadG
MTMRRATAGSVRRGRGDQGALTVELALVAPFIVLLLLGVFEFGTAYRNSDLIANGTRGAGRVESQQTQAQGIDGLALATLLAGTNGMRNMTVQRVVIYNAPSNGAVPSGCLTATITGSPPYGVSGSCNVYNATQLAAVQANPISASVNFGCGGATTGTTWDSNWCPAARSVSLTEPMGRIGVYVKYTYTEMTSLLPWRTITVTDQAVFSIQPSV